MIEEDKNYDGVDEELKRADHLIYVSLKYTRTVDVILSVIARLISVQESLIDILLEFLEKKKGVKDINMGKPYLIKIKWVREGFKKDVNVNELLDFYELLIKIMKSEHIKKGEFRKGLMLIAQDKSAEVVAEVNVDVLKEYYKNTENLVKKIQKIVK
ncbi:hypothetical protein CMI38_04945 [Candidatus Pacearchaeota archaeon]|jgi:hypothetical protein|nr:hypothetical protein [Candidatus Pacearchaeota archaeon]|tara:strand:- start:32235 stop:32705 length:471 start_codon:yes stop_codon:yes gene_type:complete